MPLKPPYTREWGKVGRYTVWLVNAPWVRAHLDEEFTDFEQPLHGRYVPRGEIWVDDANEPAEIPFFVRSAAREAARMANGETYAKAEGIVSKIEEAERKHDPAQHARVVEARLGGNDSVTVFLVKGRAVRDKFDTDYTEGGHGRVYPWMPKNAIWIDDGTKPEERPFILLHELYEWNRMGRGVPYEKAHHEASALELQARRDPSKYRDLLQAQERLAGGSLGLDRIAEFRALLSRR